MKNNIKKRIIFTLLIAISFSSFGKNVMSWIPIYGIAQSKVYMNDETKTKWLKDGLTHIGLQFWVPGDSGKVEFLTKHQFAWEAGTIDQNTKDYVAWGKTNNVKIMLCLHNVRENDFDWNYTKLIIDSFPNETVASLVALVESYGLAGVDLDLEGFGDYGSDKAAFINFTDTLGKALHNIGKELSLELVSTPCYNFPNPSWESDLSPHVDFMNLMGYADTYEKDSTLFGWCPVTPTEANSYPFQYSYIENFATVTEGIPSSQLNYGISGMDSEWGGDCVHKHLIDVANISSGGGIAIWDLRLTGQGLWLEESTWEMIEMFKNDSTGNAMAKVADACHDLVTSSVFETSNDSPVTYDGVNQIVNFSNSNGIAAFYSVSGSLLAEHNINGDQSISITGLSNGIVILKYQTNKGLFAEKLILSRNQ
jgi:hypothetical protein